jgi:hypothetical protein
MLCKHCYADIGVFGKKEHVCDEFAYRNPNNKKERKEKDVTYRRPLDKPGKRNR